MTLCPFCDLANSRIIAENDYAKVIFSNPRLTKGHLLVIPKRHIEQPWSIKKSEREAIFEFIDKYQKLLAKRLGTGCDVRQNYRPFLEQGRLKVNHLHYHLIPRVFEDELYEKSQIYEKDIFVKLKESEIAETLALLKD